MDKYYAFPSHYCLNTCSAGDNCAQALRLFLSPHTKSLVARKLVVSLYTMRDLGMQLSTFAIPVLVEKFRLILFLTTMLSLVLPHLTKA